ncbi:excisionase family DNA-binding protein [Rhodococcus sp. ANT_H53B]|uniref:excisionase family DNA-binding protein n=1 Tax=Rhodococcus sp. ANT_H53B TaxID=2597357 RepID=UPI0011EEE577|nr:excisionase family DNA-binding protein [Rhodococcus sp. ANT_H53B]KAA0925967.1 helix-turn-helix domain-containing protein [Rhodococcus sp. ANT_H53B]
MAPTRLTTIKATAERLVVNELTIRRMIARGELTAYRIGRQLRLNEAEVDGLLVPVAVGSTAGYNKTAVK